MLPAVGRAVRQLVGATNGCAKRASEKPRPTVNSRGGKYSLIIRCYSLFPKVSFLVFRQNSLTFELVGKNSLLFSLLPAKRPVSQKRVRSGLRCHVYEAVTASEGAGLATAFKEMRNIAPRGWRLKHSMVPSCSWMMP